MKQSTVQQIKLIHIINITTSTSSIQKVTIIGSSDIEIHSLNEEALTLTITGSGVISANGKANSLNATVNGSGNLLLEPLTVKYTNIAINGSGNADVFVTDAIYAVVNGSGTILYSGGPTLVSCSVVGSGKISRKM